LRLYRLAEAALNAPRMKEFFFPAAAFTSFAAIGPDSAALWERVVERWGIGAVGLVLLYFLAKWTAKRDAASLAERQRREDALNKERLNLLKRNNELQESQLAAQAKHAQTLERIVKDGNKHQADVAIELKNIARRVRCPGTTPLQD